MADVTSRPVFYPSTFDGAFTASNPVGYSESVVITYKTPPAHKTPNDSILSLSGEIWLATFASILVIGLLSVFTHRKTANHFRKRRLAFDLLRYSTDLLGTLVFEALPRWIGELRNTLHIVGWLLSATVLVTAYLCNFKSNFSVYESTLSNSLEEVLASPRRIFYVDRFSMDQFKKLEIKSPIVVKPHFDFSKELINDASAAIADLQFVNFVISMFKIDESFRRNWWYGRKKVFTLAFAFAIRRGAPSYVVEHINKRSLLFLQGDFAHKAKWNGMKYIPRSYFVEDTSNELKALTLEDIFPAFNLLILLIPFPILAFILELLFRARRSCTHFLGYYVIHDVVLLLIEDVGIKRYRAALLFDLFHATL